METKQRTEKELTPKELELVEKIAGGFNDFEISEKLNIKAQTIRRHVKEILKKTGTTNRPQLVYWACTNGILNN